MCWRTTSIHGSPTSQLTGLEGPSANFLVPYTTTHIQGSSGLNASKASKDRDTIRHEVIICLIGIQLYTRYPSFKNLFFRQTQPNNYVSHCIQQESCFGNLSDPSLYLLSNWRRKHIAV
ncbi:hypothetical protein ILYODFUR_038106 [Ilyodon furcidens]|uniref:Uncharacterized protein n=1 Tax=Ilyodon furcidens TaxID=33524 RepID=A0ABV0UR51_9TELE